MIHENAKSETFRTLTNQMPAIQANQPKETTLIDRTRQLESVTSDLEYHLAEIEEKLFGPSPSCERKEPMPGLTARITDITERQAILISRVRTILSRLGE